MHWNKKFVERLVNSGNMAPKVTPMAPSIYRLQLSQAINRDINSNLPLVIDELIPDFDDPKPSYLWHLLWCILTNDEIETDSLWYWIMQQRKEGAVPPSLNTLGEEKPMTNIVEFLPDIDKCALACASKFWSWYICDMSYCLWDTDVTYGLFCGLTYNSDCIKDAVNKRLTHSDWMKLFIVDSRALSCKLAKKLTNLLEDGMKPPPPLPASDFWDTTVSDALLGAMAHYLHKKDFIAMANVSRQWAQSLLRYSVLNKLPWTKQLIFDKSRFDKWNYVSSGWYLFSPATCIKFMLPRWYKMKHHSSHLSRFVGNGVQHYEGTFFILDMAQCDLTNLKWITIHIKQYNWSHKGVVPRFEYIHCSWYGLAHYLKHVVNHELQAVLINENYKKHCCIIFPTRVLIFNQSLIDLYTIAWQISMGDYKAVIAWCSEFNDWDYTPLLDDIGDIIDTTSSRKHLILYGCKSLYVLLRWRHLVPHVDIITVVNQLLGVLGVTKSFIAKLLHGNHYAGLNTLNLFLWRECNVTFGYEPNYNDTMDQLWDIWQPYVRQGKWPTVQQAMQCQIFDLNVDLYAHDSNKHYAFSANLASIDKNWQFEEVQKKFYDLFREKCDKPHNVYGKWQKLISTILPIIL